MSERLIELNKQPNATNQVDRTGKHLSKKTVWSIQGVVNVKCVNVMV